MKQIDKHAYGPRALVTGASCIGEFARQVAASGINVLLVGRDGILGPVRQAADDLVEGGVSTLARADVSGAFEDMKGAAAEMITARLAASQPAHQAPLPAVSQSRQTR